MPAKKARRPAKGRSATRPRKKISKASQASKPRAPKRKPTKGRSGALALLVSTRKGAFIVNPGAGPAGRVSDPLFLGHIVHHMVQDPRMPSCLLIAARTGHLGHTIFRSTDGGKVWAEATRPPSFHKAPEGETGRVVDHVFWLTPGHPSEPEVWYAGTSPQGLFKTSDGGDTWEGVDGFNENPERPNWCGEGTPDGPKLHSVIVDPRDPAHLYIAMSSGGVMESLDRGASWTALIDGMEVVAGFDRSQQIMHDPHCVRLHPARPDRLYQQNHCGIYRIDRPGRTWERIGNAMPRAVGDIGFPLEVHPRNPEVCWVFPMDGTDVWPRTSPDGKPAVYMTRNGGKSWQRQDKGLPAMNAFFTVKRQAMTVDDNDPVGIYFGTTSGEIWASRDEGRSWKPIAQHLPHIYAIEIARLGR